MEDDIARAQRAQRAHRNLGRAGRTPAGTAHSQAAWTTDADPALASGLGDRLVLSARLAGPIGPVAADLHGAIGRLCPRASERSGDLQAAGHFGRASARPG